MSEKQYNALHLYCERVAEALNDAGFDQKSVLEAKVLPTPNTKESVKGMIRLIQKAMYPPESGETSTTRLTQAQTVKVYDVFNKFLGENFEIHVEWPHA